MCGENNKMTSTKRNFPRAPEWASTEILRKYHKGAALIIVALEGVNKTYKEALITDLCTFRDFSYNPYKPLDKTALKKISNVLGIDLSFDMKLADAARQICEKRLDYSPST